jgi:hypothetical protein
MSITTLPPTAFWSAPALATGVALVTVTVKLHEAIKPAPSVAVQVTIVVPRLNVEPDGGRQVTVAVQLSVTVGE